MTLDLDRLERACRTTPGGRVLLPTVMRILLGDRVDDDRLRGDVMYALRRDERFAFRGGKRCRCVVLR